MLTRWKTATLSVFSYASWQQQTFNVTKPITEPVFWSSGKTTSLFKQSAVRPLNKPHFDDPLRKTIENSWVLFIEALNLIVTEYYREQVSTNVLLFEVYRRCRALAGVTDRLGIVWSTSCTKRFHLRQFQLNCGLRTFSWGRGGGGGGGAREKHFAMQTLKMHSHAQTAMLDGKSIWQLSATSLGFI